MGAEVEIGKYPGRDHTILPKELQSARDLLEPVMKR
jgi:hypothetical protein